MPSLRIRQCSAGFMCTARLAVPSIFLVSLCNFGAEAALNVDHYATDDMVARLREKIFVATAHVRERRGESCSSLDGPQCLSALEPGLSSAPLDGSLIGVVPDVLFRRFGPDADSEPLTQSPEYTLMAAIVQQLEDRSEGVSLSTSASSAAPDSKQRGVIRFSGLLPERRVPLTYSFGLPQNVVATWDGKWIAGESLVMSESKHSHALDLEIDSSEQDDTAAMPTQSAVQLGNSVGYLRFSKPVLVRSLLARWPRPSKIAPAAVVAARSGMDRAWSTHLDLALFRNSSEWVEIVGNPLSPVDEIAFLALSGLEIGAVDVVAVDATLTNDATSVLMLEPIQGADRIADTGSLPEADYAPQYTLSVQSLSSATLPYVMSLQEVAERKFRLAGKGEVPKRARGVLTSSTLAMSDAMQTGDVEQLEWVLRASTNENILNYHALPSYLIQGARALPASTPLPDGVLSQGLLSAILSAMSKNLSSSGLPGDLRRALSKDREDIAEGLQWILSSYEGASGTISVDPEDYENARRWRAKLDVLVAACLHMNQTESVAKSMLFA